MTRSERLAEAERKAKQQLDAHRHRLAQVQAQQRESARKAQAKRCYVVGQMAAQAGLFAWDDATLRQVLEALTVLLPCPNPVAVLEATLQDGEGTLPLLAVRDAKSTSSYRSRDRGGQAD